MTGFGDFEKLAKVNPSKKNKVVKDFPSNKPALLRAFSAYQKNLEYLIENREKLRTKYGNKYVAIHKNQVCISEVDLKTLLKEVTKKYGTSQEVVVDYVGRKQVSLLL